MKVKGINCHRSIASMLFVLSGSGVFAGSMGLAAPTDAIYIGVFGGGGANTSGSLNQGGTAFYPDSSGGPLAVNAQGGADASSMWMVGGHVGYRWPARTFNRINSNWTFAPATELEGYYIGGSTLTGNDLNNDTTRLDEHNFLVSYPMNTSVFLINAILNATPSSQGKTHPYVGLGVGTAILDISGATSTQIAPAEPGINHYNSDTSDTATAFALQPKVGLSYDLSSNTNVFVEYRFLYLSATDFTFGSTVYPGHAATSNWNVKLGSQYYNMGTIGIHYDL